MTQIPSTITRTSLDQPHCVANRRLFDFVADPSEFGPATRQRKAAHAEALEAAANMCSACPMFAQCLRDAVTGPASSGFIAGTTETDRKRLRKVLNTSEQQVDLDRITGTPRSSRVPLASLDQLLDAGLNDTDIAGQANCSLHTVARRRRARAAGAPPATSSVTTIDTEVVVAAFRTISAA